MSWKTPLEWKDVIVESYGSIAKFEDAFTVGEIRNKIKERKSVIGDLMGISIQYPDVLSKPEIKELRQEEAALDGLDGELVKWQESHARAGIATPLA